jgi:hypothetical protein
MQRRVMSLKQTDVSEMCTAFIIKQIIYINNLMMAVVRTSETSVYFNEITWRCIPERSLLHIRLRENLKFHKI